MWITFIGGAWSARLVASGKLILLRGCMGDPREYKWICSVRACVFDAVGGVERVCGFCFLVLWKKQQRSTTSYKCICWEGFGFGFGFGIQKKVKEESPINTTWESVPYSPLDRVEKSKWKQGLTDAWWFIIAYLLSFVNSEVSRLLYSLSLSLSLQLCLTLIVLVFFFVSKLWDLLNRWGGVVEDFCN